MAFGEESDWRGYLQSELLKLGRVRGVLPSAYLHALNDQTTAFLVFLGFTPFNPVFSFGIGIYAIATLAIFTLLLLRDPIWQARRDT